MTIVQHSLLLFRCAFDVQYFTGFTGSVIKTLLIHFVLGQTVDPDQTAPVLLQKEQSD